MEYKRSVLLLRPTDVVSNILFANPQGSPDFVQGIHKTCKREPRKASNIWGEGAEGYMQIKTGQQFLIDCM